MVFPEVCHSFHPSQGFLARALPFAEDHHIFRSTEGFPELHEKAHLDFLFGWSFCPEANTNAHELSFSSI